MQAPRYALDHIGEILSLMQDHEVAIFLDYDGTLSPIVDCPDRAFMADEMRAIVGAVAAKFVTAIVTGRSYQKVYEFVKLDGIYYAGSHGFDIHGPLERPIRHRVAEAMIPILRQSVHDLSKLVEHIDGAEIEDNFFSITVHYRKVAPDQVAVVEGLVDGYIRSHPELAKKHGKKVFELRPKVEWGKGHAVQWLMAALHLDRPDVIPVYIGDDLSDEDAFAVLSTMPAAISVLVSDAPRQRPTAAKYSVRDPTEVKNFLQQLLEHCNNDAVIARCRLQSDKSPVPEGSTPLSPLSPAASPAHPAPVSLDTASSEPAVRATTVPSDGSTISHAHSHSADAQVMCVTPYTPPSEGSAGAPLRICPVTWLDPPAVTVYSPMKAAEDSLPDPVPSPTENDER